MEENLYRNIVFLENLLRRKDLLETRMWRELQEMQLDFVEKKGIRQDTIFADIGCGPLRLGSALIPRLSQGWYFGIDINQKTLDAGLEILRRQSISEQNITLIATDGFDFSAIDRPLDMAFSNSLFSHLNLNSISRCLYRLRPHLKPGAEYYSTLFLVPEEGDWTESTRRDMWGSKLFTHDNRDPYHYRQSVIEDLARQVGYDAEIDDSYGHPCQTMFCFRLTSSQPIS